MILNNPDGCLFLFTGQPHEGSSYSAQKDAQMAIHRQEHLKSELNELNNICGMSEGQ